ncbi:transcriptional repressor LexA [Candidatus Omnitrophota bacterium]
MKELTPKQKKVLAFIREKIRDNMPPTIREIAMHMGFKSTGTVRDYLTALEKKGYLKRESGLSRSIELLRDTLSKIPILGTIPAGGPDLAYENIEGYVELDDLLAGQSNLFALKVKGDSMVDAGILDGDIAIIKKQSSAYKGDVVAALLGDEATLKRLRYSGSTAYLEPANKNYAPIFEDFAIIGKLVTIVRKY